MKKTKSRILASFVAVMLCFTAFSTVAFANGNDPEAKPETTAGTEQAGETEAPTTGGIEDTTDADENASDTAETETMTEEDVAELVSDSEADGGNGIVIVENDVPFSLDILSVAPFVGAEQIHGRVFHQLDIRVPCDQSERYGQDADAVIQQALPRAISGSLINTIIHSYHPRGWFATLGGLLCVRCLCQIPARFPASPLPRGCGR